MWDERAFLGAAQKLADEHAALPARLFLFPGEDGTPSMRGHLALFEPQLAARLSPGLEIISRRVPTRDHFNVLPDALRAGLHALFR